ncbi:MAG: hypothetical protein ABFC42_10145 [Sulfuricella sp.]
MSQALNVIKSVTVTDVMLTGTNVPENDYAAWAAGTTYAAGNRVIVVAEHKIYESLVGGNIGHAPASSPDYWIEVSPTNRWKLFDLSNTTQTMVGATAYYELTPGVAVNSVALINIQGITSVRIRLTDPVFGVVYDKTASLIAQISESSWYAWFFELREAPAQFIALDLPSYPTATLRVDVTADSSGYIGVLAFGYSRQIGLGVRLGARVGIQDYSRKERNTFGDVRLVQRAYARRNNLSLLVANSDLDNTVRHLANLRATPCLWIASAMYESMVVFGFYNNFEVLISYAHHAELSIDIEGMT